VRGLWVARLFISEATATKITAKHSITPDDVRTAIVCVERLIYRWDVHPERGERAIVSAAIRGRAALVVLYEANDPHGDCYNLGSAYFVDT
jgi:hypothetical protein